MSDKKQPTYFLLFCLGAIITGLATFYHSRLNQELLQYRFDTDAKRIAIEIEEISDSYHAEMHAVKAMLLSNKHIDSPAQRANIFLRYMFERNIEQEFIGLYGIGIIERVSPAKKQAFFDEMSDFYGTPFNVKSIGDRPAENTDHWIISTVYPARNNSAIGLDVTSETKRYAAIMQSLLSVQRQTTGYISLVQIDNTKEYGYLSYQPVVAADGQIRYVVYALTTYLYMLEKLGTHVLESFTLQPVQISVFDRSTRQCLMRYTTGSGGLTCNKTDRVDESIALQYVLELDKELYVITPSPKYVAYSMRNTHWITAIVGVFLSLLGVFYVRRLRYEKVLLTQRVSERTQELQHSLQEAQVAEKVKQEFLQKVSHELRTPLNGIMGVLQILTQDIDQPKQKQLLQLAEGAAFHLMGLVEDILDTAKFNHGTFILSKIAFELKPYLLNIVHMLEPSARAKNLALTISLDDKLPAWVIGDERRLRQVLINLISNAIKFTDVGNVHLAVVARNISHGEAVLRFTVEDTGIGIPADKQSEIFEEFRQVDNGLDRRHEGAGLGLSITRNILEAMNSSVSVTSEPGVGTSFQFELTLPIGSRPAENVASEPTDRELLHGMRVMVVDDVNVNLLITQSMLESRGALVMGFHSAETALKALIKSPDVDVIITDVQMPIMDGMMFTQKLRGLGLHQLPIIGLSGNATVEDREAAIASGMNDYLHKPVLTDDLIASIKRLT